MGRLPVSKRQMIPLKSLSSLLLKLLTIALARGKTVRKGITTKWQERFNFIKTATQVKMATTESRVAVTLKLKKSYSISN